MACRDTQIGMLGDPAALPSDCIHLKEFAATRWSRYGPSVYSAVTVAKRRADSTTESRDKEQRSQNRDSPTHDYAKLITTRHVIVLWAISGPAESALSSFC